MPDSTHQPTVLEWNSSCLQTVIVCVGNLESMASGVIARDPVIIAIARPGASLISTPRVA